MKNIIVKILVGIFVVGIILGLIVFSFPFLKTNNSNNVSLSILARQINEDRVDKIIIEKNKINVYLKNGEKEETIKEENLTFTENLLEFGVDKQKISDISIEIEGKGFIDVPFIIGYYILPYLLPFFITLPIIILIIWHIIKSRKNNKNQ